MEPTVHYAHRRFYKSTIEAIEQETHPHPDLCFVFVQHAFLPSLEFFGAVNNRIAAIIPKGSSAKSNPQVVSELKRKFGHRVHDSINRQVLADPSFTIDWLKRVTAGRPFAILEYGGYFASTASAISHDAELGPRLVGFVEGTENGIKGSDDGQTTGYRGVVQSLAHPVISKSKSRIKSIMDIEIGPAIVYATDSIFRRNLGCSLKHWSNSIGVIGLGSIGSGVLNTLIKDNRVPMVFDTDLSVMAELATRHNRVVSQETILQQSDVLFLNTGSCFLSNSPELLEYLKDYALLVLCTSGDVEAGIPQLLCNGDLVKIEVESNPEIAVFATRSGKKIRVLLASDGVGQAPNMSMQDGSSSPANLMSDMEFYAMGSYLSDRRRALDPARIHESPPELENIILSRWLNEFHGDCLQPVTDQSTGEPLLPYNPTGNATPSLQTQNQERKQVENQRGINARHLPCDHTPRREKTEHEAV
jgi:S-adenosylhomocysteine hydrolase